MSSRESSRRSFLVERSQIATLEKRSRKSTMSIQKVPSSTAVKPTSFAMAGCDAQSDGGGLGG